jgi:acetyl esterase/lipase
VPSLRSRFSAALLSFLAAAGCSPARLLDAVVPNGGYRLLENQPYAAGPRHSMDLYLPDTATPGSLFPVVVFFYGGNWRTGDKGIYRFVGQALASRGIAVAIPDYRLYPEVRFPGFIEDAAQAVAWLHRHAREFGLDPDGLFLMGHSAGAYSAAMVSLDERWLAAAGLDARTAVRGMIGLAGPYDFLPLGQDTRDVLGTVGDAETQPINYVDGREAPMLLITGLDDTTVRPRNTTSLAEAIRRQGGRAETRLYEKVGHVGLVTAMAAPFRTIAPVLNDVITFIDRTARPERVGRESEESSPRIAARAPSPHA